MFDPGDIYTFSGAVALRDSWTDKVTKFDTSSFYHWEQDNEPLYDLDERTYQNWEQLGFPTSAVPGLALTVSGGAVGTVQDEITPTKPNVFVSVSAAIEALPKVIRFPVIIEVANYGDLGELNLDNITIGHGGSLEIINRNFAKVYTTSAFIITSEAKGYGNILSGISSLDLSNTLTAASALDISCPVLSGAADTRVAGNFRSIFQAPGYKMEGEQTNRLAVSLADPNIRSSQPVQVGGANCFKFAPYELSPFGEDLVTGGDCSSLNEVTNENLFRRNVPTNATSAMGLVYGNYLSSIRVQNCDGPIYLRNFFVQGRTAEALKHEVGVRIANTNNLLIENTGAVGFSDAGFDIVDSDVIITRGIAAYRNYGLAGGERVIGDWNSLSAVDNINSPSGVGLRATNSLLNFSSTLDREPAGASAVDFLINFSRNNIGVELNNSILKGGIKRFTNTVEYQATQFMTELNVEAGIKATNSHINLDGRLQAYNNGNGLILDNSKVELDEFTIENNQRKGIIARNSEIFYNKNKTKYGSTNINQFEFSGNGQHLVLDKGSSFVPVNTSSMPDNIGITYFRKSHGINTPIQLGDEGAEPFTSKTWLPAISIDGGSKGVFVHSRIDREGVHVITGTGAGEAVYGAAIAANNNSRAVLQGSKTQATVVEGPRVVGTQSTSYDYQEHKAGVYAGNNSEVEFNGPTVIVQYAIDTLAEDNSVINFNPHKNQFGGLDVSGFNLWDSANHTSVELHSTRACLVANRGSIINIKDLGDFGGNWDVMANGHAAMGEFPDYITSSVAEGQDTSGFTFGGSMQFYPNPNDENPYGRDTGSASGVGMGIASLGVDSVGGAPGATVKNTFAKGSAGGDDRDSDHKGNDYNWNLANFFDDDFSINQATTADFWASSITAGGTCVRATGESKVNVQNVHFPCGWWNTSGTHYDSSSGSLCDLMFIWNIADKSYLNASYCSVSGVYPQDAGYFGPSAVWNLGDGKASFAAPSSTSDTSALSVLDFYGLRSSQNDWRIRTSPEAGLPGSLPEVIESHPYGFSTHENQGPFRLYVSVDPAANYLSSIAEPGYPQGRSGYQAQIFAQGYNLSGMMMASGTVSSLYGKVLQTSSKYHSRTDLGFPANGIPALGTSGFYYNKDFVDPGTYTRIMLDESAANTFANAKNGAMGTSDRSQICTIIPTHTTAGGESSSDENKTDGRGYKSSNIFDLGRRN